MSQERYARESRRRVAEMLEQAAEVVRLGELDAALQAVEMGAELVKRLRDELAKPGLAVVGGGGGSGEPIDRS